MCLYLKLLYVIFFLQSGQGTISLAFGLGLGFAFAFSSGVVSIGCSSLGSSMISLAVSTTGSVAGSVASSIAGAGCSLVVASFKSTTLIDIYKSGYVFFLIFSYFKRF